MKFSGLGAVGRAFVAMVFLCLLVACGGGGSSTSSQEDLTPELLPDATVSVDTSPIAFQYAQGTELTAFSSPDVKAALTKLIRVDGFDLNNPPANFGIGYFAKDSNAQIPLELTFSLASSNTIRVGFLPKTGLAPGTYTGELYLAACFLDEAFDNCVKEFAGSPSNPQRYEFTVFPRLMLGTSTASRNFSSLGMAQAFIGATQILGLQSSGDLDVTVEYSDPTDSWLSITQTISGFDHVINSQGLSLGTHVATVTGKSKSSKQQIQFTLEVSVISNSIAAGFGQNDVSIFDTTKPDDLQFSVAIQGITVGAPLPWVATSESPWISFDKASGVTGESMVYRFLPAELDKLSVNTLNDGFPSIGNIKISGANPSLGIDPIDFSIRLNRLTSKLDGVFSGPFPINLAGFDLGVEGRNLLDEPRNYIVSGPSPWRVIAGRIDLAPTVPGVYTISLGNALGLTPSSATVSFLAPSSHTSGFVILPGFKRTMKFDQMNDSLLLVDKSASRLTRISHNSGAWTATHRVIPNISDLGLSSDHQRLFVSQTDGVVRRLNPLTLQDSAFFSWTNPFSESLRLSAGLPVLRSKGDVIPILTPSFFTGSRVLPGMVMYADVSGAFQPATGYGYSPNNGGWFAGRGVGPVLFSQLTQGPFDESSAGLVNPSGIEPSFQVSQGPFPQFEKLDQGVTSGSGLAGVFDRQTLINRIGFKSQIPPLPVGFQRLGLVVSSDWRFIYVLAYPDASLNNDATTSLRPTVFVYEIKETSQNLYTVEVRAETMALDDFPTCRRVNDSSCLLDTLADTSLDGRTLFFAGDRGIAVLQVLPSLQPSVMSSRAMATRSKGPVSSSKEVKAGNSFGANAKALFTASPR